LSFATFAFLDNALAVVVAHSFNDDVCYDLWK